MSQSYYVVEISAVRARDLKSTVSSDTLKRLSESRLKLIGRQRDIKIMRLCDIEIIPDIFVLCPNSIHLP